MTGRIAFLIFVAFATGEISRDSTDIPEKSRMVGIDAIHKVPIDKDAVITRNALLPKKTAGKNAQNHRKKDEERQEREPDWSYSSFPSEVTAHVAQFKRNMSECLKEVQANDKRPVKRLSPKTSSPIHGDCLIACVLKRNGVIEHGKISKANLITLVGKFYAKDTKLMKKLEKNVDRCIDVSSRVRDECSLAATLNSCTNDLMAANKHKIQVDYNK